MQILFSADPNFIGKAIRWFTKISWVGQGRVSHAALRYGREEANWMIESNERGVVPNWFPYFSKKRKNVKQFEVLGLDEDILEKIVDEKIDGWMHKSYDYGNLIGFALIIMWYKITGKKEKNIFSWPGTFACSELIYRIFDEVKNRTGIDYMGVHDPETVFPEELLQECEKKPDLFKLVTSD
jgi:hypothetical protein